MRYMSGKKNVLKKEDDFIMETRIVYRGLEKSEIIAKHIEKHSAKIETFLEKEHGPAHMDISLEVHKPAEQKATVHIKAPHLDAYITITTNDIFTSITEALDLAYKKIHEEKKRYIQNNRKGCDGECRGHFFEKEEEEEEVIADELAAEIEEQK